MSGAELFAGAAVGLLFTSLYDAVKDAKVKIKVFKSLLEDIKSTLEDLKPLLEDMDKYHKLLDRPPQELENFKKQMKNGAELIPKCLTVRKLNILKMYKYAKKLEDLDKCLKRVFGILNVKGVVDGLETLVTVKAIREVVKQLQVDRFGKNDSVVAQNIIGFQGDDAAFETPQVIVGLDGPLRELKNKLLKDNVSMLVVTALGGSGKTTLAKKFCKDEDVKDKFKNNIFFVTVSQGSNLDAVAVSQAPAFQSKVISVLQLQQSLREAEQNPVLLVLDDVWYKSISLLQKFEEFERPDYKILVTSRSELTGYGTPYELKALNHEHSMTLLRHSAALKDKNSGVPENIREKILKHCKGIPLAITVTGKSLRGKATEFWRARLADWSKSSFLDSETEFLHHLQSSIDALDEKEAIIKECFIDLCSFPEDQRIPAAALIDIWTELYELEEDFLSIKSILELTTRGLANLVVTRKENVEVVDDYYTEHFVTQHDMLRDLAIINAKLGPIEDRKRLIVENGDKEPKWLIERTSQPTKARLLSVTSDGALSEKWKNVHLPKVEVLVLNFKTENYALPEFVEKIDRLKVLVVTNYGVSLAALSNFQLLGSLSNLRRLRLERIAIASIAMNSIELKSVKKISLFMCSIGEAFRNCCVKISDAFPSLEEMNIDYCNDLVELPADLCDLLHLKKLSITNCHKLSALPKDIGKLVNLEVLRLRSCTYLENLPDSIESLVKLDMLDISHCFSIKELPANFGEISTLTRLNMRQCTRLQELPLSVIELEQLQEVICDEETEHLWEPFSLIFGDKLKVVKENINLNWLQNARF